MKKLIVLCGLLYAFSSSATLFNIMDWRSGHARQHENQYRINPAEVMDRWEKVKNLILIYGLVIAAFTIASLASEQTRAEKIDLEESGT